MAHGPLYSGASFARDTDPNNTNGLPVISEGLNSVRTYSWECHFTLPNFNGEAGPAFDTPLVLAAKSVGEAGMSVGDIEVHRVNDKVFYPGKPVQDDLTITFDHLYKDSPSITLWEWFKTIYDPRTGQIMKNVEGGVANDFKARDVEVLQLDNKGQPISSTKFFGVYPKSWKAAEYKYGADEFHTVAMTFKYDFMDHGFHGHGGALGL